MLQVPKEKILERWDILSDALKDAVFSDATYDVSESLSEKYSLDENQKNILTANILNVLRGFQNYDDFWRLLKPDLQVNDEISSRIFMEIKEKIFNPLDKEIRAAYSPINNAPMNQEVENLSAAPLSPSFAPQESTPTPTPQMTSETINIPIPIPLPPKKETPESEISAPQTSVSETLPLPSWIASPISETSPVAESFTNPIPESIQTSPNLVPASTTETPAALVAPIDTASVISKTSEPEIIDSPIPAPFIFHQEENPITPVIAQKGINYQPLKPVFYGEGASFGEDKPNTFVKLEFGSSEIGPLKEGQASNFQPKQAVETPEPANVSVNKTPELKKSEIPVENVLNLKDLPL